MLVKMYRTGTLMHCWLEHKWYSHMENNLTVPQKFKHGIAIWPSDSIIGICSRKLKICSYKHVYTNVYSDTIHNRQKVGTTRWLSIYECINKMLIQSEVSQKEKNKCHVLMHIYGI